MDISLLAIRDRFQVIQQIHKFFMYLKSKVNKFFLTTSFCKQFHQVKAFKKEEKKIQSAKIFCERWRNMLQQQKKIS
jgi:hypothetical protein